MPFDGKLQDNLTTSLLIAGRERVAAGWCQEASRKKYLSFTGFKYEYCIIGAISKFDLIAIRLLDTAMRDLGHEHKNVVWFNDDPCTTPEMAVAVYDRAIELSRSY